MITKIKKFFEDVVFEMKKVSWPSMDELKGSTMVVLALSFVLAAFLFVVDLILSRLIHFIL
jgi:preprotein translocase subunit SecE